MILPTFTAHLDQHATLVLRDKMEKTVWGSSKSFNPIRTTVFYWLFCNWVWVPQFNYQFYLKAWKCLFHSARVMASVVGFVSKRSPRICVIVLTQHSASILKPFTSHTHVLRPLPPAGQSVCVCVCASWMCAHMGLYCRSIGFLLWPSFALFLPSAFFPSQGKSPHAKMEAIGCKGHWVPIGTTPLCPICARSMPLCFWTLQKLCTSLYPSKHF